MEKIGYGVGAFPLVGQDGEALQREEGVLHVFLPERLEQIALLGSRIELVMLSWEDFRAIILSDGVEHQPWIMPADAPHQRTKSC